MRKSASLLAALLLVFVTSGVASARSHRHNPKPPPVVMPPPVVTGSSVSKVTFYGWPDNSPPGGDIAYPVIHQSAGGTGTYADPITFATSKAEFPVGTKLYIPFLSKYVIMEDNCADCVTDWNKGISHIDIWMNSNGSFNNQVLACEDKYTQLQKTAIVTNPPSNEPVNATPLFNTTTGMCL